MTLTPFAHVIAVPDLDASVAYCRDVLGFTVGWDGADGWRLAERGELRLMLGHCPSAPPARTIGDHRWIAYVHAPDVDALHAEWSGRGADCTRPADGPHGFREFLLTTPDGHRLMFGQRLGAR